MKNILLLLICLPILGFTQKKEPTNFEVKTSALFDVGYVSSPLYANSGQQFLIVTKSGDSIHLRSFETVSLDLLSSKAYAAFPPAFGFKGLLDFKKINGKDYLFYFFEDPLLDHQDIYMQQIDSIKHEFIGPSKKIYTLKHSNSFDNPEISVDAKKNRFILHYQRMIKYENDPSYYKEYNLLLFDCSGNILHGYNYVSSYRMSKILSMNALLDSKGNIYIIINLKNKDQNKPASIERVLIPFNSDEPIITKVEINTPFIDIRKMIESKNGDVIIAGLYGKSDKKERDGFILLKLNNNIEDSSIYYIDIPLKAINSYTPKKNQDNNIRSENKGNQVGVENLILQEIIPTKDSAFLFVTENYMKLKTDVPAYRYRELIVTKLSDDFQLKWCKKIPKYQSEKAAFGYKYIAIGPDHLFIYNDHPDNLELMINEYPKVIKDYSKGVLMTTKITNLEGSIQKEIALDLNEYKNHKLKEINTSKALFDLGNSDFIFLNNTENGDFIVFKVHYN